MKISACMIVKDEAEMIGRCLLSIKGFADEIIIIDTGSTDDTIAIAMPFGATIIEREWQNDFSLHRNQSMEAATGDWVFIIDADEELIDAKELREKVERSEADVIWLSVINVYSDNRRTCLPSPRLFKRSAGVRYSGIVHNRPVMPDNMIFERLANTIKHYGYDLSPEKMLAKKERTTKLLQTRLDTDPNDAYAMMQMAQTHRIVNGRFNIRMAQKIFDYSFEAARLTDLRQNTRWPTHVQSLCIAAWAAMHIGRGGEAIALAEEAFSYKQDFLDVLLLLGYLYQNKGDLDVSTGWFRKYIKTADKYNPHEEMDSVIQNYMNHQSDAMTGIARNFELADKLDEAIAYFVGALHREPGKNVAFESLQRLWLIGELHDNEWKKCLKMAPKWDEKDSKYYDEMFDKPYDPAKLQGVYQHIVELMQDRKCKLIEVGCGTGVLAGMLASNAIQYRGFDFSKKAVEICHKRGFDESQVWEADLYNELVYRDYDTIIATEVLQHIRDYDWLALIKPGTRIIASVPNYHDPAHLRVFPSKVAITHHYKGLIDIENVWEYAFDEGLSKIFLFEGIRTAKGNGYASSESTEKMDGSDNGQGLRPKEVRPGKASSLSK